MKTFFQLNRWYTVFILVCVTGIFLGTFRALQQKDTESITPTNVSHLHDDSQLLENLEADIPRPVSGREMPASSKEDSASRRAGEPNSREVNTDHRLMDPDAQSASGALLPEEHDDTVTGMTASQPGEWIERGTELARFSHTDQETAKRQTVRLIETDFKYPHIRVVEIRSAGVARGSEEGEIHRVAMVGDHVTVGVKADVDLDRVREVAAAEGLEIRNQIADNTFLISFTPSLEEDTMEGVKSRLMDYHGLFEYVEPDYIVHTHALPSDPSGIIEGKLWGLHNLGLFEGIEGADIQAVDGWNIRKDAGQTIVAVIDTGVHRGHKKLMPNMWINPNETLNGVDSDGNGYVDDLYGIDAYSNDSDPSDEHGHGTHVAGIVGASGYNEGELVGVAWNVKIMGLRFLGPHGSGATSDAIRCIDYAREHGARILNNSWGGGCRSLALKAAIRRCEEDNVIFVASAGNANRDVDVRPSYPAAYASPAIVTVGATNHRDEPTFFSNRGFRKVNIGAPGQGILSAMAFTTERSRYLSGTSMAAPFVSGILALLDAEFPEAGSHELINRLYRGADQMSDPYRQSWQTGARANVYGALTTVSAAPINDDYEHAYHTALSSWAAWEVDSTGATFQTDEPFDPPAEASGNLWFAYTAKGENPIRISTQGTAHPVATYVFNSETRRQIPTTGEAPVVYFTPNDDTSYHITTVDTSSITGLVHLDIRQPPVNDRRSNAIPLEGLDWEVEGENGGASLAFNEAQSWGDFAPIDRSVWWKWTAPRDGRMTLSTYGSNFDTVLAVFEDETNHYIHPETTHLLFAIDRSASTRARARATYVYDANMNGISREIIDHQVASIINLFQHWRLASASGNRRWDNLKIGILVFDETTSVMDVDPSTPDVVTWTTITQDNDNDGIPDLIQALRSLRTTDLRANFVPVVETAASLLTAAHAENGTLAIFSPARDVVDMDYEDVLGTFAGAGYSLKALGPVVDADVDELQKIDTSVRLYRQYHDVFRIFEGIVAYNDDAHWHGLWSYLTFNAQQGKTYYFAVAGYMGEYGNIALRGRDPDYPYIQNQPEPVKAEIGARASMRVSASGQQPMVYQWYKDGEPILGANQPVYALWRTVPADAGIYHVEVSNVHGRVNSRKVPLSLLETAPRLTYTPEDTGFIENGYLRILAAAVGLEPITWQWYHNGNPLPDQTKALLEINNATGELHAGAYYVVASNPMGSTRSNTAQATVTSDEFANWKLRAGRLDTHNLADIAHGNSYFVAVGEQSTIVFSDDAHSWTQRHLGLEADLRGIAYGNGYFVAAGTNGHVIRASSPHHWESIGPEGQTTWNGVDFIDGVFWLTGADGQLARSVDGTVWEVVPVATNANLIGVAYGHAGFVVISAGNTYLYSVDGVYWQVDTLDEISGSAYDVWFRDILYFDGHYYFTHTGPVQKSEQVPLIALGTPFNSFARNALGLNSDLGHMVAVGGVSRYLYGFLYGKGGLGYEWRQEMGGSPRASAVAYGDGWYVTVGLQGQMYRSRDAKTWQVSWDDIQNHNLRHILYTNDVYVATGDRGAVFTSSDGSWWQQVRGTINDDARDTQVLVHQGEIFVLSPDGNHGRSTDGFTWEWFVGMPVTLAMSDGTHIYFLYSTNKVFPNIYRSTDMITVSEPLLPDEPRSVQSMAYGNGIYVIKVHNTLLTSNDGVTWNRWDDSTITGDMLVHQEGVFLSNDMRWSTDGQTWEPAGVLSQVAAPGTLVHYAVPTEYLHNWTTGYTAERWPSVPWGSIFGYDVDQQLSFPIPEDGNLESIMHGQNSSLYIVCYLKGYIAEDFLSLTLKTRFNDGLLVYINNKVVAGHNAAESASWDSLATAAKTLAETETVQVFDLTNVKDNIHWMNQRIIAFHVMNHDVNDNLFLFDFELEGLKRLTLKNVFGADGTFFGFDEQGGLYVSENARDWVKFTPEIGVLNDIIKDPSGFTGVGARGTVLQTGDQAHLAPQVFLREPALSRSVGIGDIVPLEAEAHASTGDIASVVIFADETEIATLTESPYSAEWIPQSFGSFLVYAVATDSEGMRSRSRGVSIEVAMNNPWLPVGPPPIPENLNALERIGHQWVALGKMGLIYFSEDGQHWQNRKLPTGESLLSVAVSPEGVMVVGGEEGGIFISYDDGRNWVEQDRFQHCPLNSIAYAFDRFFITGDRLIISSSLDYQDWSIQHRFKALTGKLVVGDGKLVASMRGLEIYATVDGLNWELFSSVENPYWYPATIKDIAYSGSDFYVALSLRAEYTRYTAAVARLVEGETVGIMLELPYFDHTGNYSSPRPDERLHFDANGRGLFTGHLASIYDPALEEWETAKSVSIQSRLSNQRMHLFSKHITSDGGMFYLLNDDGRILRSENGWVWETLDSEVINFWNSIRYLNDGYVALGFGGSIVTSVIENEWSIRSSGTSEILRDIAYGAGRYVVVGNSGTVLVSTNMDEWIPIEISTAKDLYAISYADGYFVLAGDEVVYRSPDGLNWEDVSPPWTDQPRPYGIRSVRKWNGIWFLVGQYNRDFWGKIIATGPLYFVSEDEGSTWTLGTLPDGSDTSYYGFGDLIYADGIYLLTECGTHIHTSIDLETWTTIAGEGRQARKAAYVDGHWLVMCARGQLSRSSNASDWEIAIESAVHYYQDHSDGGVGPAVGGAGILVGTGDQRLLRSTDGGASWAPAMGNPNRTWLLDSIVIDSNFWGVNNNGQLLRIKEEGGFEVMYPGGIMATRIYHLNGRTFAVGAQKMAVSSDDGTWSVVDLEALSESRGPSVMSLVHDGSQYLMLASLSESTVKYLVYSSADGENWMEEKSMTNPYTSSYSKIYYIDGAYYATDSRSLKRSTNMQDWSVVVNLFHNHGDNAVGYHEGLYFFNGHYSSDGINWHKGTGWSRGFAFSYSNDIFAFINNSWGERSLHLSDDGKTWSTTSNHELRLINLRAVPDGFVGLLADGSLQKLSLTDLAPVSLTWAQSQYGPDEQADAMFTLRNLGRLDWEGTVNYEIWATKSGSVYDMTSRKLGSAHWQGALSRGQEVSLPISVQLPDDLAAGEYYTVIVLDPEEVIADYNRQNNLFVTNDTSLSIPEWGVGFQVTGGGYIASSRPDTESFRHNTSETFIPVAQKGFIFTGWQDVNDAGLGPLTLIFNQNHIVQANFERGYSVETQVSGRGTVQTDPQAELYLENDSISLYPIPAAGWRFEKWTGVFESKDQPLQINISGDLFLRAHFVMDGTVDYETWIASRAPEGKREPEMDGLGFGYINIVSYFFGLSADHLNENPFRLISVSDGIELSFPLNSEARDISFDVEYSTDLTTWNLLDLTPDSQSIGDGRERIRYRIANPDAPRLFFRLKVLRHQK